jgi:preprotein translocase subunit YajC
MSFLISDVVAATATQAPQAENGFSFLMIAVVFVLFYFMLIRPQNKRAKEHRKIVENLQAGDEIVVSSSILASIVRVADQYLTVKIADGVEIVVQRSAVTTVLPQGTLKNL